MSDHRRTGGLGLAEAAERDQLFVSARTIDFHLRNIYKKFGIRPRTELAVRMADGVAG